MDDKRSICDVAPSKFKKGTGMDAPVDYYCYTCKTRAPKSDYVNDFDWYVTVERTVPYEKTDHYGPVKLCKKCNQPLDVNTTRGHVSNLVRRQ